VKNGRPLTVAFGGGTNSTAMLIGMADRGIVPGLITFADTGGEKPDTYEHVEAMQSWLAARGMPPILVVQNDGKYGTLERECMETGNLPSLAYGWKSCSDKYKRRPQEKAVKEWKPATDAWARGEKVVRAVGFGAEEPHRAARADGDDKYENWYPLIEWGWDREACIDAIASAGMKQPGKSACFYCPASKKEEVLRLKDEHPELFAVALTIERNAAENLDHIKGLGRHWSWEQLAKADGEQMRLWADPPPIACGCMDGDDDD